MLAGASGSHSLNTLKRGQIILNVQVCSNAELPGLELFTKKYNNLVFGGVFLSHQVLPSCVPIRSICIQINERFVHCNKCCSLLLWAKECGQVKGT